MHTTIWTAMYMQCYLKNFQLQGVVTSGAGKREYLLFLFTMSANANNALSVTILRLLGYGRLHRNETKLSTELQ